MILYGLMWNNNSSATGAVQYVLLIWYKLVVLFIFNQKHMERYEMKL